MMVFTSRCWPRISLSTPLRYCAGLLRLGFVAWLLTVSQLACADVIQVKSAELVPTDEVFQVNADLDIPFNETLEEALKKGVQLHFVTYFELLRPRSFWGSDYIRNWFSWIDENVASVERHTKLSYNALTRQYQLASGSQQQNFGSLSEALQELSRLREWQVVDRSLIKKRYTYQAGLRMKLDVSQLPKPIQVNALGSKSWNLESEWFRWAVNP